MVGYSKILKCLIIVDDMFGIVNATDSSVNACGECLLFPIIRIRIMIKEASVKHDLLGVPSTQLMIARFKPLGGILRQRN